MARLELVLLSDLRNFKLRIFRLTHFYTSNSVQWQHFFKARRIFPYESERTMRVYGRRILLGDERGDRAVILRLIMLHCNGVWISTGLIFSHIRKTAKGDYQLRHVRSFVRPSAWKNSSPAGRFFMKFDISVFLEYLLRKFKYH